MKYLVLNLLVFTAFFGFSQSVLQIEGKYQGKNLFVQNPYNEETQSFCVTEVVVNGEDLGTDINSTSFEIKLNSLGLESGDHVKVQIKHHEGCKPVVLNNDLAHVNRTIRIEPASLKNGTLRWKHDTDLHSYKIEQYRWNKWITVDVTINDLDDEGYSSAVLNSDLHSGTNTFRITAQNRNGIRAFSNNLIAQNDAEPVTFEMLKNERLLTFSSETQYELYDASGERIQTGKSNQIDLSQLSSGNYYLNFDNYNSKIRVK